MSAMDTWLNEIVAQIDRSAPIWVPWAAIVILSITLALVFALRRRAALKVAVSEAGASRAAVEDARTLLHTKELEAVRSEEQIVAARELYGQREAALREENFQLGNKRIELENSLIESVQRAEIAEKNLAVLNEQLKQERIAADEKVQLLAATREDMQRNFKELADAALKASGEELSKASRERLENALAPLKEHVMLFQAELKQTHEGALRDREALKLEIQMLSRRSEDVSKEAVALTRALKGDKQKQGAWGEMVLEGILERSGLRKGEEYSTQDSHAGDDGVRRRSDVIVRMPQGSSLVIDSKVSLIDYEICVNTDDNTEANAARRRHVKSLQAHIDILAAKDYARLVGHSVDYTIMFIPIEGALSEALREDGELTQFALEKSVMIATPTTLMMALRTIRNFWDFDRRNRNAEEIAKRAGLLYEKVAGFVDSMDSLGRNLNQAQISFSTAMDRLKRGSGNVLSQVDRLKHLGARTTKSIGADFDPEPDIAQLTTSGVPGAATETGQE